MPFLCLSQFLNIFNFSGGEVVGRVLITLDGENMLKEPHLRQALGDGPYPDDAIPFKVLCHPANCLFRPGETITLVILTPKEYAGRISTRTEVTQVVHHDAAASFDDSSSEIKVDYTDPDARPSAFFKTLVTVYPSDTPDTPRSSWSSICDRFGLSNWYSF